MPEGGWMQPYGPAVLRLAVGSVFLAHGAQKLFGVWGGGGLAGTTAFFSQLGLSPALLLAVIVGSLEFAGGLLLMTGAFTRVVALALAADMAVALWKVHLVNGFFLNWNLVPGRGHGMEFSLVLLGALAALALTGPGALSVDGYRQRSAETRAYGRSRLRAGRV